MNQNDVALRFTKDVILTEANDSNVVLSPSSINVLLSLIAAGSKGATKDQLLSYLGSKSIEELENTSSELVSSVFSDRSSAGGPRLSVANGVWIDKSLSFKHSFKQVLETVYRAVSNQVDFRTKAGGSRGDVNSWAEKQTDGLIKEVLPSGSVNGMTRLIFANALYFKGAWTEKFDPSETKEGDFHLLTGSSVRVPFMTSNKKQLMSNYGSFKVLGLPYNKGGDKRGFTMYIFLPHTKDGLPDLLDKFCSGPGFLDNHIPRYKVELNNFRIPKFKISFGFEASNVLKRSGLVLPFIEGDLTEMVDSIEGQGLYVSSIFQKSFIEINEEGTEAAAASAVVMSRMSLPPDFVADHPFLFLVREDTTGVIMFIGLVQNPLQTVEYAMFQ